MTTINEIPSIKLGQLLQQRDQAALQHNNNPVGVSFGETMQNMMNQVNSDQIVAATQVSDVVQGRSDNLHEAMISMTEAKVSFQLMLEVRNRLLDAYKDIEKMPM
ncbi:MAG: flagellar hook-basal body complex protein FliE [Calditrichia bacterium]